MRRSGFTIVFAIVCVSMRTLAYGADAEMDARITRLSALIRTDSSFKVRAYAARQLGALAGLGAKHDPRVVGALSDGLTDNDPVVRAIAADAIGKHDAVESAEVLERLSREDDNELVRKASESALARLRHVKVAAQAETAPAVFVRETKRTPRVELGRVQLEGGGALAKAITEAIEVLIAPHRPARSPREDPDVRLDLSITRVAPKANAQIAFEAHCVLVEMPGARLRRAANATASAKTTKKGSNAIAMLEKELAMKAATRAVTEALAMLED